MAKIHAKGPDLYEDLPTDPELAFCEFESRLRLLFLEHENETWRPERQYLTKIRAFADQFSLDVGVDFEQTNHPDDEKFRYTFNQAEQQIDYYCTKVRLSRNIGPQVGIAVYVLEPSQKTQIHHYIEQIRNIIEQSDLRSEKKEALFRRLTEFGLEVDKDRTRVENLISAFTWAKKEAAELSPVFDKIIKIFDVLGRASELAQALPSPTKRREIEGPRKKLEGPHDFSAEEAESLDDDIPF